MNSNNHMLIAHAAPSTSYDGADISATAVTGLITLEDVMETLMQVLHLLNSFLYSLCRKTTVKPYALICE